MVENSLERDVHQVLKVCLNVVWFNSNDTHILSGIVTIKKSDMMIHTYSPQ
jgi:hypothetical protein